jgi:hypothetical protein
MLGAQANTTLARNSSFPSSGDDSLHLVSSHGTASNVRRVKCMSVVASLLHAILHPRSDGGAERGCCRGRGVTHRGSRPICDGLLGTQHQWRKFLANSNVSIASRVWAGSWGLVRHLRSANTLGPHHRATATARRNEAMHSVFRSDRQVPSDAPMVAFVLRTSSIPARTIMRRPRSSSCRRRRLGF